MSEFFINLPINSQGKTSSSSSSSNNNNNASQDEIDEAFGKSFGANGQLKEFEKISTLSSPMLAVNTINSNGLLSTVHEAFANERPLILSPDHIWTAIMQAVAIHVQVNAKELRNVLVTHRGGDGNGKEKKNLVVCHDELRRGFDSPWHEVFPVFTQHLADSVKDTTLVRNATAPFTTSDETTQIVHTIALMDTMKQYYTYTVQTLCGIPRIELLGTQEDWMQVLSRAMTVCETVKMDWWIAELRSVLFQFCLLAHAPDDRTIPFWSRIYSRSAEKGSGSQPSANGWINVFFPYAVKEEGFVKRASAPVTDQAAFFQSLNQEQWWQQQSLRAGRNSRPTESYLCTSDIFDMHYPSGVSMVPFTWDYLGTQLPMTFCGGFLTAVGTVTNTASRYAATPLLAWAVVNGQAKIGAVV
jgi:hypothetical protein